MNKKKLNKVKKLKKLNFGDFVRGQLEEKYSPLSQRVNYFRKHCEDMKKYPKYYGFEWFMGLPIYKLFCSFPDDYLNRLIPYKYKNEVADYR